MTFPCLNFSQTQRPKGTLSLFLFIFSVFFRNVNSAKHHNLMKMNETADAIAPHVSQMKMQYRASAFDKKKIEHQMISVITSNYIIQGGAPKWWLYCERNCSSFSVFHKFQMDNKCSECRKLIRKCKNFFLVESNCSHPADDFPYYFGYPYRFLVVKDDRMTRQLRICVPDLLFKFL